MIYLPETSFIATNFFSKIKCEPFWKWPIREKPLENFDLFYVWEGTGEVIVNDHAYKVGKGSCFLFRPGDYTSAMHNKQNPLIITYVHFNVLGNPNLIPSRYREIVDHTDMETLLSRYVHLRLSSLFGGAEEANLILKQIMIYLLRCDKLELERSPKTTKDLQDRILGIANYIREHSSIWFKIVDLANRAQLSPRYFSMKFKELMGITVQEYEIQCRIERAEFLLHYGGMTVSETADALGYKDVYFFSKQFKKHFGKNPSTIR
ncbi:MAG: transcriptional regulator, AraC family [Bacilli bacterium]|nr:transcriptional regulator, AraC family [Bacilli bacterium]